MGTKVSAVKLLEALEIRKQFVQQFHLALAEGDVDAIVVPTSRLTLRS